MVQMFWNLHLPAWGRPTPSPSRTHGVPNKNSQIQLNFREAVASKLGLLCRATTTGDHRTAGLDIASLDRSVDIHFESGLVPSTARLYNADKEVLGNLQELMLATHTNLRTTVT